MHPVPAVVFPADRPASLGMARSLARRGIPVYGIDADPRAIAMVSRFVRPCPFPKSATTPDAQFEFLVDFGKKLGEKAVLYPVSDDSVMLASERREELQRYYRYVMPAKDTLSGLLTKDGLHSAAQQYHIPDPQMFLVSSEAEIEIIAARLPFPVILKPVFSPSWLQPEIVSMLRDGALSGPPKVALCRTFEEVIATYCRLAPYDSRMIIQEVIPGESSRLVYYCFYLDRQSRPLASFAGQKLRVLPLDFGSATYVRSFYDPELDEISMRLLRGTGYMGLGGLEFKKDPRDGCYKLIEFNTRLGLWDCFGIRCGVDIPYAAYCDALGVPMEPQQTYRRDMFWVDFQRDARAFLIYRQRKQLKFMPWLRSLMGVSEEAVFSWADMLPALVALTQLFQRPVEYFKKQLIGIRDRLHA